MKAAWGLAAAAMALVACSGNSGEARRTDQAGARAQSATAPSSSTPTVASTAAPRQRPGLWRVNTSLTGLGEQTDDICVTPEDAELPVIQPNQTGCSTPVVSRDGDAYRVVAVCGEGETRSEVRTRVTGDFQTAMRAEIETVTAGAVTMRMTSTGRYLGPCAAG